LTICLNPKHQTLNPKHLTAVQGGKGFDYVPFEKSVGMERRNVISNPLSDEMAAKQKPPPLRIERNGPCLDDKLHRRPWLTKFLSESPARNPQSLPQCKSYFTSPVVSSLEQVGVLGFVAWGLGFAIVEGRSFEPGTGWCFGWIVWVVFRV